MKYEALETEVQEIEREITRLNNEIVSLTWIDKDFKKSEVKAIQRKIDRLMDAKYEIKNLLA